MLKDVRLKLVHNSTYILAHALEGNRTISNWHKHPSLYSPLAVLILGDRIAVTNYGVYRVGLNQYH